MATATDGTTNISYAYDADGLRTSKVVNGVTHNYLYASGQLMRETYGSNTLDFFYDANGYPYALKYNGTTYYYITNLQGDVMYLIDANENTVATYEYDPYGNIVSATGTMAEINPLRYRGYYYDAELGMYYLQSRYYDPQISRFINADAQFDTDAALLGFNLFAYCANNPIAFTDTTGEGITLACILIGAAIGLVVGAVGGSHYAKHKKNLTPSDGWDYWKYVVYGGVAGGAIGALAGWAFAGTKAAATISWAYYKATTYIGTSAYAIGRAFEKWFYKAYNVIHQQVRYGSYRFDAIYKNSIIELKNYNWSCYSSYSGLINSFTRQARNYMQFVGSSICGQVIKGVTFCFSSKPPDVIIEALRAIGVTVNWL